MFVLSGFAGLIYQSVWSHYLGLILGHAAYAQTLVLAIFMGGMALGAWLASRYSVRLEAADPRLCGGRRRHRPGSAWSSIRCFVAVHRLSFPGQSFSPGIGSRGPGARIPSG